MKEQLISFEVAKLAKEKGFNEACINLWYYKPSYKDTPELHPQSTSHRRFVNCSKNYLGCNTHDYEESRITIKDLLKKPSDYPAEVSLYPAPTQSLLQKWLREKHSIHCAVWWIKSVGFYYEIGTNSKVQTGDLSFTFKTYEEALEAGLIEALKLIKL